MASRILASKSILPTIFNYTSDPKEPVANEDMKMNDVIHMDDDDDDEEFLIAPQLRKIPSIDDDDDDVDGPGNGGDNECYGLPLGEVHLEVNWPVEIQDLALRCAASSYKNSTIIRLDISYFSHGLQALIFPPFTVGMQHIGCKLICSMHG